MAIETTEERLTRFVREYSAQTWPDLEVPVPQSFDLLMMETASDLYANAHVEGEHRAFGTCEFETARECGERSAAADFVECS